jgi:hypothetical protein
MENEEGAKFCQSCGSPIGEEPAASEPEGAAPQPPSEDAPPPPPPPSTPPPKAGSKEIDWGWISKGFNEVFSDIGNYLILGLVVSLASAFTIYILAGPLIGGSLVLIRKKLRGGGAVNIGDVFTVGFDKFAPTFLFVFPTMIGVGIILWILNLIPVVGQIASIVSAALIGPFLMIGLHYIMEENAEFMDAAKNAWADMMSNLVMIAVWGLVAGIITGIGAIACGVGVFITFPAGLVMYALMLEAFYPKK